jgi:hypothetical protein
MTKSKAPKRSDIEIAIKEILHFSIESKEVKTPSLLAHVTNTWRINELDAISAGPDILVGSLTPCNSPKTTGHLLGLLAE